MPRGEDAPPHPGGMNPVLCCGFALCAERTFSNLPVPLPTVSALGFNRGSMEAGTVPEKAIISHRGEKYEIGRGKRFYGIWAVGAPYDAPVDRWPETRDGWGQAWMRFAAIEVPGTITTVPPERTGLRSALTFGRRGPKADPGPADKAVADEAVADPAGPRRRRGAAPL